MMLLMRTLSPQNMTRGKSETETETAPVAQQQDLLPQQEEARARKEAASAEERAREKAASAEERARKKAASVEERARNGK